MFVPQGINESQTITEDNSIKSWFAGSKVVNPDGPDFDGFLLDTETIDVDNS